MADNHSHDLIPGAPLWPYPALSVASFQPQDLLENLESLPEDLYVFDPSMLWTLVTTHEHNHKRRLYLAIGIE
jgi:hypothetical protein